MTADARCRRARPVVCVTSMAGRRAPIFVSFAKEDQASFRSGLGVHLKLAERSGIIEVSGHHKIPAGADYRAWVVAEIERAEIILLLVSPSFLASDDTFDIELVRAMQRHEEGAARVIPVLLQPINLALAPFADLMPLPRNHVPVALWKHADEAWTEITREILGVVDHITRSGGPAAAPVGRPGGHAGGPGKKIKMLFASASPEELEPLAIDRELRLILNRIRMAEHRDAFNIITAPAASPDDLVQALLEHTPDVIHISAHGHEDGGLILIGEKAVTGAALAQLLKQFPSVKLAVLNACHSSVEASALAGSIDVTIGMRKAVTDSAAIDFAGAFYLALGFGRSVKQAFELAQASLLVKGHTETEIPEIFLRRGVDAGSLYLLPGR